ncbi:MAG: RNA polymerase factor sigma-54 [Firmicutes bacterium]|nr:RNA polymerase factor sigma-54 [Bacillota bacterium]
MRTGYELTIEQTQKPQMTQELIQAIQILQFNNQELTDYIENELLENPVLEALKDEKSEETVDIDELRERLLELNTEALSSHDSENWGSDREEFSFERYVALTDSLVEHLLSQLEFSGLNGRECKIGRYIVQCIDDNGYLTVGTREIAEALNVDEPEVESVLTTVQSLDPIGVGARNLEECLAIQLRHNGETDKNVFDIVEKRLGDIGENRISQIAKDMNIGVKEVQEIANKIKKLEPKPGRLFSSDSAVKYVVPDVFVEKDGESFFVRSNDNGMPSLAISPLYGEMKEACEADEEVRKYLNEKLNSAMWLIKSIEQRKNTIYKVASSVLDFQDGFFRNGKKYLKPLTLKQVGEALGIHESTVKERSSMQQGIHSCSCC